MRRRTARANSELRHSTHRWRLTSRALARRHSWCGPPAPVSWPMATAAAAAEPVRPSDCSRQPIAPKPCHPAPRRLRLAPRRPLRWRRVPASSDASSTHGQSRRHRLELSRLSLGGASEIWSPSVAARLSPSYDAQTQAFVVLPDNTHTPTIDKGNNKIIIKEVGLFNTR